MRVASLPYFESSVILFSSILSNVRCKTMFGSDLVKVGENVGVGMFGGRVERRILTDSSGDFVGFGGTKR